MTFNAARGRTGFVQEPDFVHILNEWTRLLHHLRRIWKTAKSWDTKLKQHHKPQLDFSGIMLAPKGHALVMRSMRKSCGESKRCPSPHSDSQSVLPAKFLITIGDILEPLQPAFFVVSTGKPGAIHFALNYATKQLLRVRYNTNLIKGTLVDGIPTQIGDTTSKLKPEGNFWQLQPVCGEERGGTWRGEATLIPTRLSLLVAECDSDDAEMQADSEVIGDNLSLECVAVVDTGNRGPHKFLVFPSEEKESLKAFFYGMWEMLGFDPTGWDASKMVRLPNTVRGKGRGGQPQMQTLLWFALTPTRLVPNSKFQTLDDFKAAFAEAVMANADSVMEQCKQMEEAIAKLEKQIAAGKQRLGCKLKRKSGRKNKISNSSASDDRNSDDVEARQKMSGPVFREGRTILQERLRLAGDKLILPPEEKAAVVDVLAKHHTLYDDPIANHREMAGVVDEICVTPHRPIGKGRRHGHRPAQNVSDEEFYKSLNFPYTAAFWATEWCRARLQRTEECYVEFAFVALLLYKACGLCRTDILRWLREFYKSRSHEPCNAHIEVPGQTCISYRVREVTERVLPPDQSKEVLKRWNRHYGCESDLDELLSTMVKHLAAAGWKPWAWIDEDLYRLEQKYWTKEQAQCGAYRLARISVAVEAILAEQALIKGKKKRTPKVTTEMVYDWLETHSEYDFPIFGKRDKREAKLTSILRGLRELVKAGHLRESGSGHKKTPGKELIFRPSKTGDKSLVKQEVTGQQGDGRPTYKAYYLEGDVTSASDQPLTEAITELKAEPTTSTPTEASAVAKADSTTTSAPTQTPGDQASQATPAATSQIQATVVAKVGNRRAKMSPQAPIDPRVAQPRSKARGLNSRTSERDADRLDAEKAKAYNKAEAKARATPKLAKPKKPQSLGVPGVTFKLQTVPRDGTIVVGRLDNGKDRKELVGGISRIKVKPMVTFDGLPVRLILESTEEYDNGFAITCLLPLSSEEEKGLLAKGHLKPKNPVLGPFGERYLRVKFNRPCYRLPRQFASRTDAELESAPPTHIKVLWLQSRQVDAEGSKPYWILESKRMESWHSPALAAMTHARAADQRQQTIHASMHIKRRMNNSSLGGKFSENT